MYLSYLCMFVCITKVVPLLLKRGRKSELKSYCYCFLTFEIKGVLWSELQYDLCVCSQTTEDISGHIRL